MEDNNFNVEKTNRVPSWLIRVTPFSKYLTMFFFVTLPFVGFILGIKYQKTIGPIFEMQTKPIIVKATPAVTSSLPDKSMVRPTPFARTASYFNEFTIILDNGGVINNYYTKSWFWCGGSNGDRVLGKEYASFVEVIGKTTQDQNVYILKVDAPYPMDQHLVPSTKKALNENGENGEPVSKEDWGTFLSNQLHDYPMIIVKDSAGKMNFYFRQDYVYLPGC